MDLKEVGWGDMEWIDLAYDWYRWWALVNVDSVSIKCEKFIEYLRMC